MKDHSNPLSRPYHVRLAEMGFVHYVALPDSIEPYTLDDLNRWLQDQGYKPKIDFTMTNWKYVFRDPALAMMFALRWGG